MPAARPKGVALTRSIASSRLANGARHMTGPKISQASDLHTGVDIRQQGRRQHRSLARAARQAPGAFAHGFLDPGVDADGFLFGDQRSDDGVGVDGGRHISAP